MTYKLRYISDSGRSVSFGLESGIVISKFSDPTSQNISFDTATRADNMGEKIGAQRVEGKYFSLSGVLLGDAANNRKKLLQTIIPLQKGRMIFDDAYEIEVYPSKTPEIERYPDNPNFNFALYAPYPFWRTQAQNSVTLMGLTKSFRFPWNISDPNPFRFSTRTISAYTNAYNAGNVPAKWKLEFYAHTRVKNPHIENMLTGAVVRLLLELAPGEKALIDTTGQEVSVTRYSAEGTAADAFDTLDINSQFFTLAVGDNLIKTGAADNLSGLDARLIYASYVSGVYA